MFEKHEPRQLCEHSVAHFHFGHFGDLHYVDASRGLIARNSKHLYILTAKQAHHGHIRSKCHMLESMYVPFHQVFTQGGEHDLAFLLSDAARCVSGCRSRSSHEIIALNILSAAAAKTYTVGAKACVCHT